MVDIAAATEAHKRGQNSPLFSCLYLFVSNLSPKSYKKYEKILKIALKYFTKYLFFAYLHF